MREEEPAFFESILDRVTHHAKNRPDHIAILESDKSISWSELDQRVRWLAKSLTEYGIVRGSVVAVELRSGLAFLEVILSIWYLGAVVVPVPSQFSEASLKSLILNCGLNLVIHDRGENIIIAIDSLGTSVLDYTKISPPDDKNCVGHSIDSVNAIKPEKMLPQDPISILYSSGTTSKPKGVLHSHGARCNGIQNLVGAFRLGHESRTLVATPLYTTLTWNSMLPTLFAGGTTIFLGSFSPEAFLRLTRAARPTFTFLVPSQYSLILESELVMERDLECFDLAACAGAKLDPTLKRRLAEKLPARFVEIYGASEGDAFSMWGPSVTCEKIDSVGTALEGVEFRVVDFGGEVLERNKAGEVLVASESLMDGYHNDPIATESSIYHDLESGRRFYRTGDVGVLDDQGALTILGRADDVIITGAYNVHPADIEKIMLLHGDVSEVAVVGLSHPTLGQTPVAFVVLKDGAKADASAICRWTNSRLSSHQRLFVVYAKSVLPRNANGKILRRVLRSELAKEGVKLVTTVDDQSALGRR